MKHLLILALVISSASCAQTVFYHAGQPIARFQGDMTGMSYSQDKDGSITWSSAVVSHSTATLAQGSAASDKISHLGTAAAVAGISALVR